MSALLMMLSAFLCAAVVGAEIGIANPGFENGREAWSFDRGNAFVVDDVSHAGLRAACIEVDDAMKDCLYVKRSVPIEGGGVYAAECFVKTEDVRKAKCALGSVGAGLIVEWSDKNKNWIGTGKYACGIWGTTGWQKVVCDDLKAPAEAAYAIVFLALRGAGKAWFDDVSFSRLEVSVEKLSPINGDAIVANTPLFTWKESHGARSYSVLLSRDSAFSQGVLTNATEGLMSFRLTKRLNPGLWYWKVLAPGRDDSSPWSFVQKASVSQDCLPPEVVSPGARVLSPRDAFEVVVRGDSLKSDNLVFQGQHALFVKSLGKGMGSFRFLPPSGGWAKGLTVGNICGRDEAGNKSSSVFYLLNAPRPHNYVNIDRDGFYTVGGERFFPLSIYEVKPIYFKEMRDAGFDNVHLYSWEGSQDDERCRSYLDDCWKADGLRAFIGFDRGSESGNGLIQGNYAHIASRIGVLADHPALFCWYLYDEPELMDHFVSPARLKSYAELIRALDPFHPVVLSTWNNAMVGIRDYRPAWDVHWTQAYGTPDHMLGIIESQRERLVEFSPMTLILGCNDGALAEVRRRGEVPDPNRFERDYDQFRASAYLGVIKGFNALSWWWFAKDRMDFYSAAQSPKGWRDLTRVVDEIRRMRPLILSRGVVKSGKVVVDGSSVVWWQKRYKGKYWLIVVNTSNKRVTVELVLPHFGKIKRTFDRYGVWTISR